MKHRVMLSRCSHLIRIDAEIGIKSESGIAVKVGMYCQGRVLRNIVILRIV